MDFLKTYLDSVKELECPESYHIYAALGMLSSLPGKKIWSRRGAITTYPNIYVCLIGDAGSGKTTAMSLARGVLRKVDGINFAKKCPSAQEVIECCAAAQEEFDVDGKKYFHAPMAIFLSELSNFIQLSPELMIPFLTDAYDDDIFDYGTRHKGKFVIKEPVLSAVTCCTHSWLTDQQKNIRFNDGIGRRFLWLMDSPKERNPRPKAVLPPEILEVCKKIRTISGEFEWSKEAAKWWDDWYSDYDRAGNGHTQSYFSTKHVHLEKLAMLVALADRQQRQFAASDFERGLEILSLMEKNLHRVFENMGRNELHPIANRCLDIVKSHGSEGISLHSLRSYLYQNANGRESEEIISHLTNSKVIKSNRSGNFVLNDI